MDTKNNILRKIKKINKLINTADATKENNLKRINTLIQPFDDTTFMFFLLSKNIRCHVIKTSSKNENTDRFVQLEHIKSGIIVTKCHKSLNEAKNLAMKEIEELINLWKNCI